MTGTGMNLGLVPWTRQERGAVAYVVLVMMLLAVLAALGTARTQWLSERSVGIEADMQRAQAAAEALMNDARLDVQGFRADGTPCSTAADQVGCRNSTAGRPFFPLDLQDRETVKALLDASGQPCVDGICMPDSPDAWTPAFLKAQLGVLTRSGVGATYGQFTGASAQAAGNPLLNPATPRAWYWVEVFGYARSGELSRPAGSVPVPSLVSPLVFRITVHVQGLRPGTRVWLRSVLVFEDPPQTL
jgi:type IV pilus assembly protein PilX